MTTTLDAPQAADPDVRGEYRIIGTNLTGHDFVAKVRGELLYAADWQLPGLLHGKVVRSTMPSARIVSLDVSAARAVPGVICVLTADDVPHNAIVENASGGLGELMIEMPVLASDRVRYVGEPLALIAAETKDALELAAELVEVEYEELDAVFDPAQALAEGAPLVHDAGNTLVTWGINRGDVDGAFARAHAVIDGTYQSQHVEHAYMEPEAGVGWIDQNVVTLRISTQVIEHSAKIATILNIPHNRVRVIASFMGGGFGGKEDMTVEPYLALLVWHTRRPVRMIWDRQESIVASTKRHPFTMHYRTAVTEDGQILAQDIDILGDAGAYPYLSARILFAGAALSCGPYLTPAVRIRSRAAFTNNLPTSAFRGFGAMQVTFGYESQMDRIADELGVDRVAVRQRNFLRKGDLIPTGETLSTAVAVDETRQRALAALGDKPQPSGPRKRVGRGFACAMQPYGRTIWFRDRASAWLSVGTDGTVLLRCGVTDLGAGQAATLCQIVCEVLGVSLDDISVYIGDTALTPPAGGTFATRQLFMSGNAVLATATQLRDRMAAVAADTLGTSVDDLVFADGRVSATSLGTSLTLGELAAACDRQSISTAHLSTWRASEGRFDPATGQGASFPDYTFGTHAADVEVDLDTGEVTVLRYVASHDVGRALNPQRVAGQIQGGAMQGLGYALMEEVRLTEGYVDSPLFANYLIPTAMDMPDIRVEIVESGEGKGPLNARGIGEPPIGPPAPTIANAIADALGARPTRLPMNAERIVALLTEAGHDES